MRALLRRLSAPTIAKVSRYAARVASYDLELGLQLRAREETCAYIEERLSTCVATKSATELLDFAIAQCPKAGLICEFGVFKGKSINHLARKLSPRIVHGFDSFEGLPEHWRAGFEKGAFTTAVPRVKGNVRLHKGLFENSLPEFVKSLPEPNAALLHVDCDLYSSTRTIFQWLGETISAGTIVLFDEYFNYPGWKQHEWRALQEFCVATRRTYEYLAYNSRHEQVVIRFQ